MYYYHDHDHSCFLSSPHEALEPVSYTPNLQYRVTPLTSYRAPASRYSVQSIEYMYMVLLEAGLSYKGRRTRSINPPCLLCPASRTADVHATSRITSKERKVKSHSYYIFKPTPFFVFSLGRGYICSSTTYTSVALCRFSPAVSSYGIAITAVCTEQSTRSLLRVDLEAWYDLT